MTAPDFMPVLSGGPHDKPEDGACLMEYVSILAGEPFSDQPSCTDRTLARIAQTANDVLYEDERHQLLPFIGRLIGTPALTLEQLPEFWLAMSAAGVHQCCRSRGGCGSAGLNRCDASEVLGVALDCYDKVTGRTSHRDLTGDEYRTLAAAVPA